MCVPLDTSERSEIFGLVTGKMERRLTKDFKLMNVFLVIFVFICEILSSEVPRPRGVSLSRAPLYPPGKHFTCFDGSKTIPFSQVNDDYCDCLDSSDEPGTSACPNGVFHCTNAGYKPLNLASNRVNDGICDCCDGTDEYANEKPCQNNCIELGRSAREEALRRAELVKAGTQLKAELSQKGIQQRQAKQTELEEVLKNRDEAEKVRAEKDGLRKEAEELEKTALEYYRKLEEEAKQKKAEEEAAKTRAEAEEIFSKFDSNQDGLLDVSELQTRQPFDKDRNGEVSEEEAKYFLNNQESVDLQTFIDSCWSIVKPYLIIDSGVFKSPEAEAEESQSEAEDLQDGDEEHDEEAHEDEEEEEEQEPEQPEEEQHEETTGIIYDEETKKLMDRAVAARKEYDDADKQFRNLGIKIKGLQDYLETDFGAEEEFATLQGQCFEHEDHEYIYKLCPFQQTSQHPKSTAAETVLGHWGRWTGPEDNKYETMLYDRGQSCWNGPQRSTKVQVECGGESRITGVSEPNRCEYQFNFITPAACRELPADAAYEDLHDEL